MYYQGGKYRLFFTPEKFIAELKKYDCNDGAFMREFAVKELNIRSSVEKYLAIYEKENADKKDLDKKIVEWHSGFNELLTRIDMQNAQIDKFYAQIIKTSSSKAMRLIVLLRKIKRKIIKRQLLFLFLI